MTRIDEDLKKKLSPQDQSTVTEMSEEGGLVDMIKLSFLGSGAWLTYYIYIIGFAAFFAAVYLTVNFLATADIKTSITYAVGINVCVLILVIVKIIGWQNMLHLELMREIKRLEMRVMKLSK